VRRTEPRSVPARHEPDVIVRSSTRGALPVFAAPPWASDRTISPGALL